MKLAYRTFQEDIVETITKDYYIRGLHPKLQVALKSIPDLTKTDQCVGYRDYQIANSRDSINRNQQDKQSY